MKTIVYVDGLNLYYGLFLTRLRADPESPNRQRIYLKALRTMPPKKVTIVEGKMELSRQHMRLVRPQAGSPSVVQVYRLCEKKTDVNLASDLISDAFLGHYDQAVVCSNDSDFAPAMAAVRKYCPDVRLGLVVPIYQPQSWRATKTPHQFSFVDMKDFAVL